MSDDLTELYQEVILDHNHHPRNFTEVPEATHQAQGFNPLCGDRLTVFLEVRDGRIAKVGFQGSGCAISRASASIMTTCIQGKTPAEAIELFRRVHEMVTGEGTADAEFGELGDLAALSGVRRFPIRVKCATLAWHTLRAALEEKGAVVSTE
jgi:nitrogen fixation NifU-like protein